MLLLRGKMRSWLLIICYFCIPLKNPWVQGFFFPFAKHFIFVQSSPAEFFFFCTNGIQSVINKGNKHAGLCIEFRQVVFFVLSIFYSSVPNLLFSTKNWMKVRKHLLHLYFELILGKDDEYSEWNTFSLKWHPASWPQIKSTVKCGSVSGHK